MTNVAIACQGGGSHTAFTAGVLEEVLPWLETHDCELVGLSGTSGGAVSAVAAWNGYLVGGAEGARERLAGIWTDVAASSPLEAAFNASLVWGLRANAMGLPVPVFSPSLVPWAGLARDRFLEVLERHVDFERFEELAGGDAPELHVGTVDVEAGAFETFTNAGVTPEAVLASAAIPSVFEAVELHGHAHWDGLFSQNPPIHDLMAVEAARKPDELWIVQINPQTVAEVPRTLDEIADRRNELAGNISLNQEIRFIEHVNDWVAAGDLTDERYRTVEVRKLILDRHLGYSTKFARSRDFLAELMAEGRETAAGFLDDVEGDLHGHEHH
jgi:NTE family protein